MILEDYIPDLNRDYYCTQHRVLYPFKTENKCGCCVKLYKIYECDICETVANDSMYKTEKGDACNECFQRESLREITDIDELKKRYDTIHYDIPYEKKFEEENVNVYVIYEYNNNSYNKRCEYFLLCLRDDKIILNHKIQSYNPYFGIYIQDCKVNETTIEIMYREKQSICKVILEFDNNNEDTEYIKYGLYNYNPVGKIAEFKKNDNIMEYKSYFK